MWWFLPRIVIHYLNQYWPIKSFITVYDNNHNISMYPFQITTTSPDGRWVDHIDIQPFLLMRDAIHTWMKHTVHLRNAAVSSYHKLTTLNSEWFLHPASHLLTRRAPPKAFVLADSHWWKQRHHALWFMLEIRWRPRITNVEPPSDFCHKTH